MENDYNFELKQEMLTGGVLDKQLKYKKEYSDQKERLVTKWKSKILEKYGKGGQFYYCPNDELYYYADKSEAKYYKLCPKCNKYICPFCYYADDFSYSDEITCCIRGKIKHKFFYDIYYYISPKEIKIRGEEVEKKPWKHNYIPFFGLIMFETNCTSSLYSRLYCHKKKTHYFYSHHYYVRDFEIVIRCCFWSFISIPYFFQHYIFIAILLLISTFNKKPFLYYCGIVDRGSRYRLEFFLKI